MMSASDSFSQESKSDFHLKFLLIGHQGVGKSSLLARYINDKFAKSYIPTMVMESLTKQVKMRNKDINLQLLDTTGQERFKGASFPYYGSTDSAIIVVSNGSQSREDVLTQAQDSMNEFAQNNKNKNVIISVVYNEVSPDEKENKEKLKQYCKANNLILYVVNAMTGARIQETFNKLIAVCLNQVFPLTPEEEKQASKCYEMSGYRALKTTIFGISISVQKPGFFRLFGSHHLERSDEASAALKLLKGDEEKVSFLDNQLDLLEGKEIVNPVFPSIIDKKWTTGKATNTLVKNNYTSGFYDSVLQLRNELDTVYHREKPKAKIC